MPKKHKTEKIYINIKQITGTVEGLNRLKFDDRYTFTLCTFAGNYEFSRTTKLWNVKLSDIDELGMSKKCWLCGCNHLHHTHNKKSKKFSCRCGTCLIPSTSQLALKMGWVD